MLSKERFALRVPSAKPQMSLLDATIVDRDGVPVSTQQDLETDRTVLCLFPGLHCRLKMQVVESRLSEVPLAELLVWTDNFDME